MYTNYWEEEYISTILLKRISTYVACQKKVMPLDQNNQRKNSC